MKEFWENRWEDDTHAPNIYERAKLELLLDRFPGGVESVLDVGCGTGWVLEALGSRFERAVGMDFAFEGLKQLKHAPVQATCSALPFRDGSFDLVLATEVVEHLDDEALQRMISEVRRVSRRYVLVTTPYAEDREVNMVRCDRCFAVFHSSLHVRSFTEDSFAAAFAEAGLEPVWIQPSGSVEPRSALLTKLNGALTGYFHYWRPHLRCPVCANPAIRRRRARERALSFVVEAMQRAIGSLRPSRPHNLCGLFEKVHV